MGDTWYDSLQVKFTKRYSHGLTAQVAYTFQKELTNGVNSNTSYLTPDAPLINDVFNPKAGQAAFRLRYSPGVDHYLHLHHSQIAADGGRNESACRGSRATGV